MSNIAILQPQQPPSLPKPVPPSSTTRLLKKKKQTKAESHLKNILTNRVLFPQSQLDQSIFQTDLVIEMKVPQQPYIKRSQKFELGSIVRRIPKALQNAYEMSYLQLYNDMQEKGDQVRKQNNNDQQLVIRQFMAFRKLNVNLNNDNGHLYNEVNLGDGQINSGEENSEQEIGKKNKKVILQNGIQQQILLNCQQQYSGILDAFIISYNTLIYALQKYCGFKVKSFLVQPSKTDEVPIDNCLQLKFLKKNMVINQLYCKIFIFLYLPDNLVIKAANKYKIKKETDYVQIDPFGNDPADYVERPLRYSKYIKNYLVRSSNDKIRNTRYKLSKFRNNQNNVEKTMIKSGRLENQPIYFKRRKTIDRKIGFILPDSSRGASIVNQVKLTDKQLINFQQFSKQFDKQIQKLVAKDNEITDENNNDKAIEDEQWQGYNCFNDPQDIDAITPQQKDYLYRLTNYKYNLGIQKLYTKLKKQRHYYNILKQLSIKYKYKVHQIPTIFTEFKLLPKTKKFLNRLHHLLLYKQNLVSPYGRLELFNKMQRIKLAYSVLREHIRIQNLYMLHCNIFALSNDYQKYGKLGKNTSKNFHYCYQQQNRQIIKDTYGGLNGRNLDIDWYQILIYKTNFTTIRNYLGQSRTFEIFIKTFMINMFLFLAPIGIMMEVIKTVIIYPNASRTAYFPQFWFYMVYLLFATVIYGIFIEWYRQSQVNYMKNFVEENPITEFINQYRGPYMRDIINDNANTYNQKFRHWIDSLKEYLVIFVFLCILGTQIGFYYGMRQAIVGLSYTIPEFDTSKFYLLRPIQLIGYSIFFVVNAILYQFFIVPLSGFLTKLENRPTKQSFKNSQNFKLYIFSISIQLIGPIDLVFIQYASKTSCSSDWCFKQLQSYAYCRYMLILLFTFLSGILVLGRYLKNRNINFFEEDNKYAQFSFSRKFSLFLQFVYNQSKKQPCRDVVFVYQTVALIQFSTFLTVFPLGSTISFVSMLLYYNVQRMEILQNQQRPIPKSQTLPTYRKIVVAIGHWMLFFNFSQMFITLEWLQYLFQNVVLFILPQPSPYSIMTLKYGVILFFMMVYEMIMYLVTKIVKKWQKVIDNRKWNMYQKFGIKNLNSGTGITLNLPKPIQSISRTFNKINGRHHHHHHKQKKQNKSDVEEKSKWLHQEYGTENQLQMKVKYEENGKKKTMRNQ